MNFERMRFEDFQPQRAAAPPGYIAAIDFNGHAAQTLKDHDSARRWSGYPERLGAGAVL
jgi:hypothetical protein